MTAGGGDVRGFYEALGIDLPGWAHTEAPVRCFSDPDAHNREDRDASCSVNLESGAFNCHGCGARGGAYDAAVACGRSPRAAIDLMVTFGLTERRLRGVQQRPAPQRARRQAVPAHTRPELSITAADVEGWAERLRRSDTLLHRLERERAWSRRALADLSIGFDGERITVPIWQSVDDGPAALSGVLRLRIDQSQEPKVIAVAGTRLGLIPSLASTKERRVLLLEGPSDLLAARSAGLPAIAVPGANAWRAEWSRQFDGRSVVIVMDCDRAGRHSAARIAGDLGHRGTVAGIFDLAPGRDDGYDVSDWLRQGNLATELLAPAHTYSVRTYMRPAPDRLRAQPAATGQLAATRRDMACRPS